MTLRRTLGTLLEVAVVVLVVALVAGQLLGQPLFLGFVTSESMQPTLDPGDGFVAVPPELAGDIEEGDVITFRAEEIQGGGLTTHRVVGETDRGYVTKGDNNPFTDQDGDEPPVKRAQAVAVAWQPGGTVLAIPGVGAVVTGTQDALTTVQQQLAQLLGTGAVLGTQGLAYLLLALSVLGYVADLAWNGRRKDRERDASRESGTSARLLIAVFAGALVLAATVTMVAPAGPQEFGVVSAESDGPGLGVIEAGTNESAQYSLVNGGHVPVVSFLEPATDGVDVTPRETRIPGGEQVNATLTLSAPPETGYYREYLVEHRYLAVLPQSHIHALYQAHPWLPIVVIDALIGVPFYLIGVTLVGRGRLRERESDRPLELTLRRSIRRLYR